MSPDSGHAEAVRIEDRSAPPPAKELVMNPVVDLMERPDATAFVVVS
jgi:hypothetical protein